MDANSSVCWVLKWEESDLQKPCSDCDAHSDHGRHVGFRRRASSRPSQQPERGWNGSTVLASVAAVRPAPLPLHCVTFDDDVTDAAHHVTSTSRVVLTLGRAVSGTGGALITVTFCVFQLTNQSVASAGRGAGGASRCSGLCLPRGGVEQVRLARVSAPMAISRETRRIPQAAVRLEGGRACVKENSPLPPKKKATFLSHFSLCAVSWRF